MPGSPATRVTEPGTMPPPRTRLSSWEPTWIRGTSSACTSDSSTAGADVPVQWRLSWASCLNSASVFHSPHERHRPSHFGLSAPQLSQTYTILGLAKGSLAVCLVQKDLRAMQV